jgi:hypothetical protein
MTIPRNKNLTKQLNSYFYVITITLQGLLQRTKRALSLTEVRFRYGGRGGLGVVWYGCGRGAILVLCDVWALGLFVFGCRSIYSFCVGFGVFIYSSLFLLSKKRIIIIINK